MKSARLILCVAVLCPLVGCEWLRSKGGDQNRPRPTGALDPVQPSQLVTYLNERSGRLQSITDADVRVVAKSGIMSQTLQCTLYAAQPRNFRMAGDSGAVGAKVDLGSNPDQFWVYAKIPTLDPMFVYASHTDFDTGRAKIPGGIPFEPDWVMQAFGMTTFSPNNRYTVKTDDKARTYTLRWPAVTPGGASVIKEVVFDGDAATGTRPQVKRHVIRDTKDKVICYAEIKAAKTVQTGGVDAKGLPLAVQYPTSMELKWVEQKFEMDLLVRSAKINEPLTPEKTRYFFSRPNIPNTKPIDLARYDLSSK